MDISHRIHYNVLSLPNAVIIIIITIIIIIIITTYTDNSIVSRVASSYYDWKYIR